MIEQSFDSKFLRIVGPAIFGAVGAALPWLTGGSGNWAAAETTLFAFVGGIGALTFSIMYRRYLGVLASGGARKESPARADYDALRDSLSGENVAVRIYKQRLRAFLDRIERFFGDAGMADRTLFPRVFGLKTPAPLWTAPAFDRCLLLALIYPILAIVLIWVISGHIGPAEAALHLPPGTSGWQRTAGVILISLSSYAWWLCYRAESWVKKLAWFVGALAFSSAVAGVFAVAVAIADAIAVTGALAVAGFFARTFAGIFGFAVALIVTVVVAAATTVALTGTSAVVVTLGVAITIAAAVTFASSLSGAFAFASAVAIAAAVAVAYAGGGSVAIAVAFALGFSGAVAFALSFAGAVAFAFAGAFAITSALDSEQHYAIFRAVLFVGALALIIAVPALLAPGPTWTTVGPLFLFIGLLTVINAPFDWISLGLTRALLLRGLELGGWWPYLLALTDAALAALIITLLAAAMTIGVQAFDTVAVHRGAEPVLPLTELFNGVASHRSEPEYWWLYALLISSMIPSVLNLAIGGGAFLRGVPGLPSVLLGFLPAGKAVAPFNRGWVALVLTTQTFAGAILGLAAQTVLAVGVIGYGLPWLGFQILDVARDIADFNLPERAWTLFVG